MDELLHLETDVECYDCGKKAKHLPHFKMVRMCEDCIEIISESDKETK